MERERSGNDGEFQEKDDVKRQAAVQALADLIHSLPGVQGWMGVGAPEDTHWWIKFSIDRRHKLAWHVIQRLGFVFNYYSLEYRFSTVFMPVSPPPYLNGGPEFLSWVVEATAPYYDPVHVTKALREVLPKDLASEDEWTRDDTE